ncbi:MAG: hypothetical protein ACRCU2_18165 [Planktothrix sp.]
MTVISGRSQLGPNWISVGTDSYLGRRSHLGSCRISVGSGSLEAIAPAQVR